MLHTITMNHLTLYTDFGAFDLEKIISHKYVHINISKKKATEIAPHIRHFYELRIRAQKDQTVYEIKSAKILLKNAYLCIIRIKRSI